MDTKPPSIAPIVRFGIFTVDLRTGELRKAGTRIRLQEQPFRVLRVLLERPNEIVTREELRSRVWPDMFVDFDFAMNTAIRKIRTALGDSADVPRFIETLPRRGYRFIAPVEEIAAAPPVQPEVVLEAPRVSTQPEVVLENPRVSAPPRRSRIWTAAALAILGALSGAFWLVRPAAPPRVLKYVSITNDAAEKFAPLATDGVRLYFNQRTEAGVAIAEVSVSGESPPSAAWTGYQLVDLSPSGSVLLAQRHTPEVLLGQDAPFWLLPLPAGPPRLLALTGHAAAWSPNGEKLAYSRGSEIYLARNDGSDSRRLLALPATVGRIRWSPDGKNIRVDVTPNGSYVGASVWEASVASATPHLLLAAESWSGDWMRRSNEFVFSRAAAATSDLWLLPSPRRIYLKPQPPAQLTFGPINFSAPTASPDGKKLFAIGQAPRGQLVRYDSLSGQFVPYLEGLSADNVVFSRDGQWVAYILWPEKTLWRSRTDGSERLQLTFPLERAIHPRWSPDGRSIAFSGERIKQRGRFKMKIVPFTGGTPLELVPGDSSETGPSWSPDGRFLAFGGAPWLKNWTATSTAIRVHDFATGSVSELPGSQGLWAPKWSPDGRYVVAEAADSQEFRILDRASGKWTSLARVNDIIGYSCFSRDGSYLYFNLSIRQEIYRVRLSDRHLERVLRVKGLRVLDSTGYWFGLAPDDSPLLLRDASFQEIYALDVEWP